MTGITKLEASILWGNGFKLQDEEGEIYTAVGGEDNTIKLDHPNIRFSIGLDMIGVNYFIIARPLSQLTEEIEPGIVPIVELTKIEGFSLKDDTITFGITPGQKIIYARRGQYRLMFKNGDFHLFSGETPSNTNNQPALFAYMDSLHFDRFNWKERGLTTEKLK